MGRVKIDIHKNEYEWRYVNLSTIESIKGLLKYRSRFDLLFERGINPNSLESYQDLDKMIEEAMVTYWWLDDIIKKCDFNDKQKNFLNLYMRGYTEEDISKVFNISQANVNGIIDSICKKIKDEALREWRKWVYVKKLELKTKKCSKCGEELPATDEFFSFKNDSKDGFHPYCKKCR